MKAKVTVEVDRLTRTATFQAIAKDGARTVIGKGQSRGEAVEQLKIRLLNHRALDLLESTYPQEVEIEL